MNSYHNKEPSSSCSRNPTLNAAFSVIRNEPHILVELASQRFVFTELGSVNNEITIAARSSSRPGGGLHQASLREQTPPQDQAPTPSPREQTPRPGPGTPPGADPPVDRITDACENITLPQLRGGR